MRDFNTILAEWLNKHNNKQFDPSNGDPSVKYCDEFLQAAKAVRDLDRDTWKVAKQLFTKYAPFQDAAAMINAAHVVSDLDGHYPSGIEDFVNVYIASRKLQMLFNDQWLVPNRTDEEDINWLETQMMNWCFDFKMFKDKPLIGRNIAQWMKTRRREIIKETYEQVKYDGRSDTTPIDVFLHCILTEERLADPEYYRAAKAALKTWIWRIKNHLRGKWQHRYHVMLVLYGVQFSGKSTIADWLKSAMGALSTNQDFRIFSDMSSMILLTRFYVINFDDMSKAVKADVDALKENMTVPEKHMRDIYEKPAFRRYVFTSLGSSNKHVASIIRDETGMRRFFELECRDRIDETYKEMNILDLWRCVDEDAEISPIFDDFDAVQAHQKELTAVSLIEEWVDCDLRDLTGAISILQRQYDKGIPATPLVEQFGKWRFALNIDYKQAMSPQIMSTTLQEILKRRPELGRCQRDNKAKAMKFFFNLQNDANQPPTPEEKIIRGRWDQHNKTR